MAYKSLMVWAKLNSFIGTEEGIYINRRICDVDEKIHLRPLNSTIVYCGSRAEGLCLSGSDSDILTVINNISVSENSENSDVDIVMDTNNMKPGVARLRCLDRMRNNRDFVFAMEHSSDGTFLSSLRLRDKTVWAAMQHQSTSFAHGPCATVITPFKDEIDVLFGFSCKAWPRIASEWVERSRNNNWPSPDLIADVVSDGCLLVPIGNPHSHESHMQWRISFSLAEKKLIRSFNHTQMMCYGLLKLYLKHVIELNDEVRGLLCSYFLKTCLLFCIEEENIVWSEENLLDCFWKCYKRLMKWVCDEYCPNFFIKSNNMFEGKVSGKRGRLLYNHLNKLYGRLDSFSCIPCLSKLHIFNTDRTLLELIPTEISISHEEREYLCDKKIFSHLYQIDHNEKFILKQQMLQISQMLQESHNQVDSAILTLHAHTTHCKMVHVYYKDINGTKSHKSHYKQITGLKQFIIDNCMVNVSNGMLMLATLCYLNGEYKRVVTIIQKTLTRFKSYTMYFGRDKTQCRKQSYIDAICGKGLTINQKLNFDNVAYSYFMDLNYKFHPQEIEADLVQHSISHEVTIPPIVYAKVLLFLSYFHMDCREKIFSTIKELDTATKDYDHLVTEDEIPLATALLQRCRQMFKAYEQRLKTIETLKSPISVLYDIVS